MGCAYAKEENQVGEISALHKRRPSQVNFNVRKLLVKAIRTNPAFKTILNDLIAQEFEYLIDAMEPFNLDKGSYLFEIGAPMFLRW